METRKEMEKDLAGKGISGPALELVLKFTARARHAARVEATRKVAEGTGVPIISLLLDLVGVGGRLGLEGGSTSRFAPFRILGKGRKQASDGGAYMAAAEDALRSLLCEVAEEGKIPSIVPFNDVDDRWGVVVNVDDPETGKGDATEVAFPTEETRGWFAALAGNILCKGEETFSRYGIRMDAGWERAWSEAYNRWASTEPLPVVSLVS